MSYIDSSGHCRVLSHPCEGRDWRLQMRSLLNSPPQVLVCPHSYML